jgi:SAM-dependent methyltransferase
MTDPDAPPLSRTCPACLSSALEQVERVSVDRIAAAWARQDAWRGVDATEVAARVSADLRTDAVAFLRCRRCGLESADPPRAWSADHYPPEEYGICWDHLRALDLLRREPPGLLLEIGCADGKFLEQAAALGHHVTGIDFAEHRVAAARARGVPAQVADVRQVAAVARVDRFDYLVMFQVIEHLEQPDEVFEAIGAIAAPRSLLVAACPAASRYTRRVPHADRIGRSDFWDYPPMHLLRWSEEGLRIFLARHGWRLERAECEPFSLIAAAAHLTATNGLAGGWYASPVRRRLETLAWMVRLLAERVRGPMTGIRLLAVARRGGC